MSISSESVRQLLHSEDFGDRLRAVNQLRQIDRATAFELIQLAVADNNVRVRYAAISQLSTLGTENRARSLELLRDRLLNDSEADVQAAAADSLSALQLTEAFPDLEALYHSTGEWLVQLSIVAALGELGDTRALPLLEEALGSTNDLVKISAIGALGELKDERAIPLLIPYVTHPDWQIRLKVVQAFSHLQGAAVTEALGTLAQDSAEQVATQAREILATQ